MFTAVITNSVLHVFDVFVYLLIVNLCGVVTNGFDMPVTVPHPLIV